MRDDDSMSGGVEGDLEAWGWHIMGRQDKSTLAQRVQYLKQKEEEIKREFTAAVDRQQKEEAERTTMWKRRIRDLKQQQDEDMEQLRQKRVQETRMCYEELQPVRSEMVVSRNYLYSSMSSD